MDGSYLGPPILFSTPQSRKSMSAQLSKIEKEYKFLRSLPGFYENESPRQILPEDNTDHNVLLEYFYTYAKRKKGSTCCYLFNCGDQLQIHMCESEMTLTVHMKDIPNNGKKLTHPSLKILENHLKSYLKTAKKRGLLWQEAT